MRASPSPHDELQATLNYLSGKSAPVDEERTRFCHSDLTHDDLTGLAFGPYVLGAKLGGGGMGKVFIARHVHLGKEFALKFITADAADSPEACLRFDQEVKALGKLQHPNIVSAVDAGCIDGVQYLATERIDGQDLWQVVKRRGALRVADACELIRQAALGLAHSHACGILHRDIKPANLILDRQGVVKILDFGLMRATKSEQLLTMDGVVMGTLDFIAPEQAQDARRVDERSDLYSLGCTLLHLLSGRPPYHAEQYATPAAKIKGHLLDTPVWLNQGADQLPLQLTLLLRRLLAKEPGKRIATAGEVAELLAPFCAGQQVSQLFEEGDSRELTLNTTHSRRYSRRWLIGGSVAACGLVTAGLAATAFQRNLNTNSPPKPPQAVVAGPETKDVAASNTSDGELPANRQEDNSILPEPNLERVTITTTPQTSEPKQTANAAAIKVKFSSPAPKNLFQPISGRTEEPWKQPLQGK